MIRMNWLHLTVPRTAVAMLSSQGFGSMVILPALWGWVGAPLSDLMHLSLRGDMITTSG